MKHAVDWAEAIPRLFQHGPHFIDLRHVRGGNQHVRPELLETHHFADLLARLVLLGVALQPSRPILPLRKAVAPNQNKISLEIPGQVLRQRQPEGAKAAGYKVRSLLSQRRRILARVLRLKPRIRLNPAPTAAVCDHGTRSDFEEIGGKLVQEPFLTSAARFRQLDVDAAATHI